MIKFALAGVDVDLTANSMEAEEATTFIKSTIDESPDVQRGRSTSQALLHSPGTHGEQPRRLIFLRIITPSPFCVQGIPSNISSYTRL